MRRDGQWCTFLGVWLAAMLAGGAAVWRYELAPAEVSAELPARWPDGGAIVRVDGVATLVMLAHPRCPCTRASLAELARLVADTHGRVDAHVLVVRPAGAPEGWEDTDLRARAAAIPGVRVHTDIGGEEARRFGATASGHVVIYDPTGRLLFHGGITGARGHEGDNAGRSGASAAIARGLADQRSPTFGCELADPDDVTRGSDG